MELANHLNSDSPKSDIKKSLQELHDAQKKALAPAMTDTLIIRPSRPKRQVSRQPQKLGTTQAINADEDNRFDVANQRESCLGHKRSLKLHMLHIARNIEFHTSLQAQKLTRPDNGADPRGIKRGNPGNSGACAIF